MAKQLNAYVSVIIPALNEEKNIGRCLQSLIDVDAPADSFEVVLVDNGSIDGTIDIASSFKDRLKLTVIKAPGVSIARMRNIGVEHSSGSVLAFVDADCSVRKDWIRNAIRHFEDTSVGAAGSSCNVPKDYSWVATAWDMNNSMRRKPGCTEFLPTGNLFVPREHFAAISGFDESLATNEDYDLCYRLRQRGLSVYSDPEIHVTHWGVPTDLLSFYKREVWHGTHVLKVFLKDVRKLKNLRAVLYSLYYDLAAAFLAVSVATLFLTASILPLAVSGVMMVLPPALLSIKTLRKYGFSLKFFLHLYVIYLVYGLARARSNLFLENWRR